MTQFCLSSPFFEARNGTESLGLGILGRHGRVYWVDHPEMRKTKGEGGRVPAGCVYSIYGKVQCKVLEGRVGREKQNQWAII